MPSGKVHDQITAVTALAAVPIWWLASPTKDFVALSLGLGAYLFSGFWLSDDLDTNCVAYKRWGILRGLWWPYQKLVPHRSWISHGLAVGPLIRVLYFMGMVWLGVRLGSWLLAKWGMAVDRNALTLHAWQHTILWTHAHPVWALWSLLGLILGGVTHSVADAVVSWAKRVW